MRNSLIQIWQGGKDEVLLVLIVALVGFGGFGLGRLSVKETKKEPVSILNSFEKSGQTASVVSSSNSPNPANFSNNTNESNSSGSVVASKKGKVYHLPWCLGAMKIKPENLIYFKNAEQAEKAGLKPASNCKGL